MATLTKSGRTALAVSLKTQALHLAWGAGDPLWETNHTANFEFEADQIQLPHELVKNVTVSGNVLGEDYTLDGNVITRINPEVPGIVAVSYTVDTPQESVFANALLSEIGRRIIDEVTFCVGDENGLLVTPTGRFSAVETPTNQLYFHCTFDFEDAATETIRELGIFMGTEVAASCPPGQRYFAPSDLTNPGILLVCENTVPLIRTNATREAFSFVVTL
jgi:hypothetical protein